VRTNIEIDDRLMAEALAAGPFKTKKEAVEAGLVLLKRQAAMRELARMGGSVAWGWGDEQRLDGRPNWGVAEPAPVIRAAAQAAEPAAAYGVAKKPQSGAKSRARR